MVVSSRAIVGAGTRHGRARPARGPVARPAARRRRPPHGQQHVDRGARPRRSPPVIGTVDMDAVFKSYDKVKVSSEEFKAAAMAKKNELMKIQAEAQQEAEMLAKLTPGQRRLKKHEDQITQLKAQLEAGREQAEREFASREAETLATLYKEIQAMVARVAKWKKMTYVVQVSNEPVTGGNPTRSWPRWPTRWSTPTRATTSPTTWSST